MTVQAEHDFWGTLSAIGLAIVAVAVLAVVVSKNSNTTGVIQATGTAFQGSLATALSPVTGSTSGAGSSIASLSTFPIY